MKAILVPEEFVIARLSNAGLKYCTVIKYRVWFMSRNIKFGKKRVHGKIFRKLTFDYYMRHIAGSKRIVVKRVIVSFGEMWNYSCFFFSRTAIKRPVMCRLRRDYISR